LKRKNIFKTLIKIQTYCSHHLKTTKINPQTKGTPYHHIMEDTLELATPMQEKIEKLKTMILEGDKTGYNDSDNQWKRDEKLQQKLRYLQFYEAYSVGKSPKSWKCGNCREVEVSRSVITYPGCSMQGKCKHTISHKKEKKENVSEWLCEDEKAHEEEWVNEEKSTVAMRNQIKRQYSAMIAKEKEVKTNKKSKNKYNRKTLAEEIKVVQIPSQQEKPMEKEKHIESTQSSQGKVCVQENFHSDECKTCVKMKKLMGHILPHPVNI
jgi:hypothetical protein